MIFSTIEKEANISGLKITNVFSQAAKNIRTIFSQNFTNTISFDGAFSKSLAADETALIKYSIALKNGMSDQEAFNATMTKASAAAQANARDVDEITGESVAEFTAQQKMAEIVTLSKNKSLTNVRSIINTYNTGLSELGLTQEQFAQSVSQGNATLGNYISSVGVGNAKMSSYIGSLVGAKVATIGMRVATMALNTTISMGASLIISGIVKAISEWYVSEEELAEEVEEVTSKFQQQKSELQETKNRLDELSPKYEKLSKGVNALGQNVSLSTSEYSEYQDVVNEIAKMMPSLVQGYDEQGNAILSCKGNVEELTAAYYELIKASNNEVITKGNDIFKNFENALDDADGYGQKDFNLNTAKSLKKLLNSPKLDEQTYKDVIGYGTITQQQILNAFSDKIKEFNPNEYKTAWEYIKECMQEDYASVKAIIDNFYAQFDEEVQQMSSYVDAYIGNSLLSGEYSNISSSIKSIINSITSQFDYEFYSQFDNSEDLRDFLKDMLNDFNKLDIGDQKSLSIAFDIQTKFNNSQCGVGEYISNLNNLNSIIEGFDKDTQKAIKLLFGFDDDDTEKQYNNLIKRLENNGVSPSVAKEFANDLTKEELSVALDIFPSESSSDYLNYTKKQLQEEINEYKAAAEQTLEGINQSVTNSLQNTQSIINSIASAKDALLSQSTGNSLSLEDYNSDELKEYTSALEYHNGVLQLNAEKVREIVKAKSEEQIETNNTNKAMAQSTYLENAAKIEKLRQEIKGKTGESRKSIQDEINALLEENSAIKESCDSYDLMTASLQEATDAYHNWLNAQNASQSGDMFDDALNAVNRINETLNKSESEYYGRVGRSDYQTSLELIIPDSIDSSDKEKVNSYLKSIYDLFTYDEDGNYAGLNIENFCQKAVDKGLMVFDKSKDSYKIAGQKTMEDFAEGLKLSMPIVQAAFGEMEEFGGKFSWADEAPKTIGDLGVAANEAAESLRQMKDYKDLEIRLDVSDIDDSDTKISTLETTIKKMQRIKGKAKVDASEVEYANQIIEYCVAQQQSLSEPIVMRVDTSAISERNSEAIGYVKEIGSEKYGLLFDITQKGDYIGFGCESNTTGIYDSKLVYDVNDDTVKTFVDISVDGNMYVSGNITSPSDITLKTNIDDTKIDALDKINQIELKEFDWIENNEHENIGIIAQQLQDILPDLVCENNGNSKLAIKTTKFIPYLIKAIQELYSLVETKNNNLTNPKK